MSRTTAFLSGCAASAAAIAAIVLLTGAKGPPPKFDEIDVGRINIREPDGTLRMVTPEGQPSIRMLNDKGETAKVIDLSSK
ncbi:hypothetical protein [Rubrivivax rivuli]|uniref:Uncharacterized protein n=1 Tax=Rubrivivax rivuli TaxID=1862385 RepID=A0A437RAT2_9BURK|nr:hypothetical protein [Rubrivivax rivuli]RVU43891.1 hypothetical protein EOE66_19745 [Rubrivivax rivuli]